MATYLDAKNGTKTKKSTAATFTGIPDQLISTDAFGFISSSFLPLATETTPGVAEIATQAEVNAGLDDQRFITPLKLDNSTRVVHTFGNETINGVKTFNEDVPIIIDAPSASDNLEVGYFTNITPNGYGIRADSSTDYFVFMPNADNPQLVMGSPSNVTGNAFIDVENGRPLFLNTLPTGAGGVGGRGLVTVGQAGLSVASLDATQAPNLQLTTVTGSTDYNIYTGSPGVFDGSLVFAIGGGADLFEIENDGTLSVETVAYETLVLADNDIPNKKYVDDAIVASGGPSVSAIWKYDGNTSPGPSSGEFRTNNNNPALVTQLYISDETEDGADFSLILSSFDTGSRIFLQNVEDSSEFIVATTTASPVDNGSYFTYAITVDDSGTTFDDGKNFGFIFFTASGVTEELNDLTAAVVWDIVPDAFISQSSVTQHEAAINHDALLNFVPNEHIDWTIDQGGTNIDPANVELALDDLTDVDLTTTTPVTGDVLYWDGSNWVPSEEVLRINVDGCSVSTVDDTGLDWCNFQVGGAGSAFTVLKSANGTIATPTVLNLGDKIGGWGFIAFDDATSNPGFVSTEISSYATETQSATNGGAELRFETTETGTKTKLVRLVLEDDGTLNVADQTDYELKVTDDDDIPNKKYVDDLVSPSDQPSLGYITSSTVNLSTTPIFVPLPDVALLENDTSVIAQNPGDNTRFDIKEDGRYGGSLNFVVNATGGILVTVEAVLNGTTVIAGSSFTTNPTNNGAAVTPLLLGERVAGDFVQIRAFTSTGTGTIESDSGVYLFKLSGTRGPQGLTGSGSTITLEEGGTPVTNTPHDTVDFSESFFSVTDNGDGSATVSSRPSFIQVLSNGGSDNTVNYNLTSPVKLDLNGTVNTLGSGFSWDSTNDWVLCSFDGWVEVSYNVPVTSTSTLNSLEGRAVRENVAGTVQTELGFGYSIVRSPQGPTHDISGTTLFEVSNGEKIFVWLDRSGTTTGATNITQTAELIVKRIS